MATDSISPGKRRKDSLSQLRRDRPLFANRRPKQSRHQNDFFTESLNTSFVPTPSPKKSPIRQNGRPQPRAAQGSGPSLTSAFHAISNNQIDTKPNTSSSEDQDAKGALKPMPKHIRGRSPQNSNTHDPPSTPSPPPRGRQGFLSSPASSASASSPPRGLAEAYQRIVDEENLAQDDTEAFDYTEDFVYRDPGSYERRMQRRRDSGSPISMRTLRKSTSRELQTTNGSIDGEVTHESSPRLSSEDHTRSSLDSGLSQHEKDARRLNGAINSEIKAFSKAKVGPRHSLSAHMLGRHNASAESLHSSVSGSTHSRLSEPSMNVPKAWGRKSKPSKHWLDRIKSPSGTLTGDTSRAKKTKSLIVTESESRDWNEPIDKWVQFAAKTPLPEGEESSHEPSSSQLTINGKKEVDGDTADLGENGQNWDNDDFTARSLQVSQSPPLKAQTPALNRMRSQELDSLEKRAVTTNRLGQFKEKESKENLRRISLNTEPQRRDFEEPFATQDKGKEGETNEAKQYPGLAGPVADSSVVVSRSTDPGILDRPAHSRQEPHDLLRQLARSTSNSPHPTSSHGIEIPMTKGSLDDSAVSARKYTRTSETPQQTQHTLSTKTPKVTGGWIDTILEDTPRDPIPDLGNKKSQYLKTPLVTGAWIDTPLPVGGRGPPMPTPSEMDEDSALQLRDDTRKVAASELIRKLSPRTTLSSLRSTATPLPKSALESVITAAKADTRFDKETDSEEDASLHLGDSTIASLEGIMAHDKRAHPPTPPSSTEDNTTDTIATPYTRQLKRLQSLVPSLRSTRKNISSLERAVSMSNERKPNQAEECHEGGQVHDFIWPCAKCGGGAQASSFSLVSFNVHDKFTTLEIPLPKLWTRYKDGRRGRLTWLGIFTLLFWTWWIAETVAYAWYCHHPFSTGHVGFGFDYDAPEPPFVLEKILYRSLSVGTFLHPLYLLLRFLVQQSASAVGYLAGFSSGGTAGNMGVGRQQPPPAWEGDGSMMNDEYL